MSIVFFPGFCLICFHKIPKYILYLKVRFKSSKLLKLLCIVKFIWIKKMMMNTKKKSIEKHWHRSNGSTQIKRWNSTIDCTWYQEKKKKNVHTHKHTHLYWIFTLHVVCSEFWQNEKNSIATYCIQTFLIFHSKNFISSIFNNIHQMGWGRRKKNECQHHRAYSFYLSIFLCGDGMTRDG